MMEKTNKISTEDLQAIHNAKANAAYMRVLAEKAYVEAEAAELQVKNITLMAYLKYGLSNNNSIDNEGYIIRANEETPIEVPDVPVLPVPPVLQPLTKKKKII